MHIDNNSQEILSSCDMFWKTGRPPDQSVRCTGQPGRRHLFRRGPKLKTDRLTVDCQPVEAETRPTVRTTHLQILQEGPSTRDNLRRHRRQTA